MIFDADGLIKLNRAGILFTVAKKFNCLVPPEVYYEAVTAGLAMHYPDAVGIEHIISSSMTISPGPATSSPIPFGMGETAAWGLLLNTESAAIVSDDVGFVRFLTANSVPCIVPGDLLSAMVKLDFITKQKALEALNKLRLIIQASQFDRALEAINDYSTES